VLQRHLHGYHNVILYQSGADGGSSQKYLRQIYYLSPAEAAGSALFTQFGAEAISEWGSGSIVESSGLPCLWI
jgi:hypothetical protein